MNYIELCDIIRINVILLVILLRYIILGLTQ